MQQSTLSTHKKKCKHAETGVETHTHGCTGKHSHRQTCIHRHKHTHKYLYYTHTHTPLSAVLSGQSLAGVGGLVWVNNNSIIAMDALLSTLGIGEVKAPYAPWSFTQRWDFTHWGYWASSRYKTSLQLMLLYYAWYTRPSEQRDIGKLGCTWLTSKSVAENKHTHNFTFASVPVLLYFCPAPPSSGPALIVGSLMMFTAANTHTELSVCLRWVLLMNIITGSHFLLQLFN